MAMSFLKITTSSNYMEQYMWVTVTFHGEENSGSASLYPHPIL